MIYFLSFFLLPSPLPSTSFSNKEELIFFFFSSSSSLLYTPHLHPMEYPPQQVWIPIWKEFLGADLSPNTRGCTAQQCPLRRHGRSAALERMVRELAARAAPSLRRFRWPVLWTGRLAMAQGRLPSHVNLDLAPWREILWCSRSLGHPRRLPAK
jgi:hypothetical protein